MVRDTLLYPILGLAFPQNRSAFRTLSNEEVRPRFPGAVQLAWQVGVGNWDKPGGDLGCGASPRAPLCLSKFRDAPYVEDPGSFSIRLVQ